MNYLHNSNILRPFLLLCAVFICSSWPAFSQQLLNDVGSSVSSSNSSSPIVPIPRKPVDTIHYNPFVPAFQMGSFSFAAAAVRANYGFGPGTVSGINNSQFGFGGGLLSSPFPGKSQFEFDAGFHHYSTSYPNDFSTSANSITASTIYFWNQCDWRFGPTAGFNLNTFSSTYNGMSYGSTNSYHSFNAGGYGQWLPPTCHFTGSAKAGLLFGNDSGWYGGFDLGYYFCDDFDFCGGYDYISYDAWKVYSLRADWQVSETTPIAVSAGFNYNAYGNGSSDTRYSIGLKYQWNVPTSTSLEDREHTGLLSNYQFRF